MGVKIRLARIGTKGQPSYRVVVADERTARRGKCIEILGNYNPLVEPLVFKVDKERVLEWIKKGAQPTFTVRKLLGKIGVLRALDFSTYKKKAPRSKGAKEEKAEEKPAEAKPAEAKPAQK